MQTKHATIAKTGPLMHNTEVDLQVKCMRQDNVCVFSPGHFPPLEALINGDTGTPRASQG